MGTTNLVTESDITVKEVKDSDLVVSQNNQALTTSLKVSEYFKKQHSHVLRAIERAISTIPNASKNGPVENGFILATYKDPKGEERPMYYLNRDAFTFVVMGFTGEKAAIWKWRYIQAFNRMEAALREQQQNKPMDLADQLMVQAKLNIEVRNRLTNLEGTVQEQGIVLKRLQQAHNGITLRHEMKNNDQQKQLDRHEEDIINLQKNMFELLQEKSDISQDLDIFIKSFVNTYDGYQMLGSRERYQTAWNDFYKAIAEEAGKPNPDGYIMSLVNRKRKELVKNGVSETTAKKNVTGKTVVNSYPELKNAAIAIMTRITEDIKNHETEKLQTK